MISNLNNPSCNRPSVSFEGVGISLRPEFLPFIQTLFPRISGVEILVERYLLDLLSRDEELALLPKNMPVLGHSVSLSLGSFDWRPPSYIDRLSKLCDRINPTQISEHLSYCSTDTVQLRNFVPIPYTELSLGLVGRNVLELETRIKRPVCLENPAAPFVNPLSNIAEAGFLYRLYKEFGCKTLLDVNNLYQNAVNLGFDPHEYIDCLCDDTVSYIHVAGFSRGKGLLYDSHAEPVDPAVWELLAYSLAKTSATGVILERDEFMGEAREIHAELDMAWSIWKSIRG